MIYWPSFLIMKLIDLIYFRAKYSGLENLPVKQPYILACNHISNLDPFIVGVCQWRRFSFLAKEELFKAAFTNWFFRNVGAFPIRRGTSDFRALREAVKRLRGGCPLIVFPEGTRGVSNIEKQAQPGVGFLALKGNVPVIPVFIHGSDSALPNGAKWFKFHPISVKFGHPLVFSKGKDYTQISTEILSAIYKLAD